MSSEPASSDVQPDTFANLNKEQSQAEEAKEEEVKSEDGANDDIIAVREDSDDAISS